MNEPPRRKRTCYEACGSIRWRPTRCRGRSPRVWCWRCEKRLDDLLRGQLGNEVGGRHAKKTSQLNRIGFTDSAAPGENAADCGCANFSRLRKVGLRDL